MDTSRRRIMADLLAGQPSMPVQGKGAFIDALAQALQHTASLPQRALGAAGDLQRTGEYDPEPVTDVAMSMVGAPGVPRGALGSSMSKWTPDQRYGDTWYHGTSAPEFKVFDPRKGGEASGSAHDHPAVFMTNDPALAESYANASGRTMRDSFTYGEYKKEIQDPLVAALNDLPEPLKRVFGNARSADDAVQGNLLFEQFGQHGAAPEQIARIRHLVEKSKAAEMERSTVEGARVMPLMARGDDYLQMSMFPGFNEAHWDLALKTAAEQGRAGVHFKKVVDSPTGKGDPADVLAVFDPKNIRSKFAKLNPRADDTGYLLGGLAMSPFIAQALLDERQK